MEEDDDLFLVIIENESEDGKIPQPMIIKQELNDTTAMAVEDIIETVEKHGTFIDIKGESQFDEYDYLENEDDQILDEKLNIKEYHLGFDEEHDLGNNKNITRRIKSKHHRRTMLSPEERKSFVDDLKEQYQELKDDEMLLVTTLSEIMRSEKPPLPPEDHFFQNEDDFICTRCDVVTKSLPAAGRHYQEYHGPRYLVCYACGVDFRSKTNLYKHEKRCSAPSAKIVLKARAISIGSKARSRPYLHLRRIVAPRTTMGNFECSMCSDKFNTKLALISHEHMHRGERPYQCHVCPAAYTSKPALVRHEKKHTNEQYICDHCKRSFKFRSTLIAHMNTHLPLKRYGCEECGRRYVQKSGLELHVNRVHRNLPPPFACPICAKRYPRMSLLKNHMNDSHGLLIMTRKMFLKKLPLLSDSEVHQVAKLVFKEKQEIKSEELNNEERMRDFFKSHGSHEEYEEYDNGNVEIIVPDEMPSEGFLAYVRNVNSKAAGSKGYAIINGEIVVKPADS